MKLGRLTIWIDAETRLMAKKPAERIERNILLLLEIELTMRMGAKYFAFSKDSGIVGTC